MPKQKNLASYSVLKPLDDTDWSKVMQVPPETNFSQFSKRAQQIFHFNSRNKQLTMTAKSGRALKLVKNEFKYATPLESDAQVLKFGLDHVTLDGAFIELGVATGLTINFIAGLNPTRVIYGFDSFRGLPIKWDRPDKDIGKGTFAYLDSSYIPPVLRNVKLFKGLFDKTLPQFKTQILKKKSIAFIHIDCDTYESTRDAFAALGNNIKPGTVMVFDELYGYPNYENNEWKAFQEFLNKKKFAAEYLAYNVNHEQAALRIRRA